MNWPEHLKVFESIAELRPVQEKALKAGILDGQNLLVCTPTSSGKTLVGEIALLNAVLSKKGKGIYVVPLRALASEKFKDFKRKYEGLAKIALSSGDIDSDDSYLIDYDIIICTAEKLDSLLRHRAIWISSVKVAVFDEIHMINDPNRGPTLEVLITLLKKILPKLQIIGLSATIGNPKELAEWLSAKLIIDSWRPVELHKGVYFEGVVEFH